MHNKGNAGAAPTAPGAMNVSRKTSADIPSFTDTDAGLQGFQATIIARRFGLAPAVARQVAEQAFGAGGAG